MHNIETGYQKEIDTLIANDESSPSAVRDFKKLVSSYVIVNGRLDIGPTGYLDYPVLTKTFCGTDDDGRVFVNLVVDTIGMRNGVESRRRRQAFTVFQLYTDDNNLFVTGGEVSPMLDCDFIGEGEQKFDCLEKLLEGESLTFFALKYTDDLDVIKDPDNWVTMTLVL